MLSDFRKILYVSDLEQGARPAFRAAVSLCNHYDSRITYLHVIESVSATARSVLSNMMEKQDIEGFLQEGVDKLRAKVKGRLERFCEQELSEHEKMNPDQVEVRVEEGTPWKVILKVADQMDADVIVMGTRKHSTLGQILLGSTAAKTLSHSKRPVLVVPLAD
ncbi:universal stress protein [Marinospirillum alkaliphilum]|uniref:Nucleotide-binding universal stress protein, UspA family n=1 Tax=Marinospirillum alkaliphilum DSM 21637 TaxID=1122209 RepID=A0A1K1V115_9GAMM|nr:universal stress protein [Marinospirillum alkaliphilum]SFX18775.1 Nucleotide-binding universal stress protein, UspA family [Marinospirillum alkaliphilum DSM 21637]